MSKAGSLEATPPAESAAVATSPPEKNWRRKSTVDHSRRLRLVVQWLFLALNVWIGVQFYLFVRYFETGAGPHVERPPGVEGWLPIASLMNLKAFLQTGSLPAHHAAGLFLLLSFLLICFLFRKSFCSWLCPVGTVSEMLWKIGYSTFRRNWRLPKWLDLPLRGVKYLLMGLFLYAVGSMSAISIRAFLDGPYGVIADVKMLNFFRYLGVAGAVTLGLILLLSIFIKNFWCRYLCPYGALLGLVGAAGPLRVRRSAESCIDCAKCARACPSLIPVDRLTSVRTPECTACYECIAVCPAEGALEMRAGKRRLPAWATAAAIALIFLGFVGYARITGHWHSVVPDSVYSQLIPRAGEFGHP